MEDSKKEGVISATEDDKKDPGINKGGDEVTPVSTTPRLNRTRLLLILMAIIAIIVVVAVPVALRDDDDDEEDTEEFIPDHINFETGLSLVTYWGINATISSRLAQTVVNIEVANFLDCTSIHSLTLQLPLAARIVSLETIANDGCRTFGKVQTLKEAREMFVETAAQGLPGAYIEERDSFTYSVQVVLPPLGSTNVTLVLEQLLRQRVGEIEFQIPFEPIERVDQIEIDLTILDVGEIQDEVNLDLDMDFQASNDTSTPSFHLAIPDAREHDLPRILRGWYTPGVLPNEGVLYKDGSCFEHFFLPSGLEVMPKNILFLFDISNSYKFNEAKMALNSLIDTLSPLDTLTIQTFANRGTEGLWGAAKATNEEKIEAKAFVNRLQPEYSGSNLFEAYGEGLLRFKRRITDDDIDVNILMLLSNSYPSSGQTNRSKIADAVWKGNQDGRVKLFSLGFPDADMELLRAIAIMNGGVAAPLLEGYTDFATQITEFFESEFGSVLTSDVNVTFSSDVAVLGSTRSVFPVLADGTELVVRGLLSDTPQTLQATTKAVTKDGVEMWTIDAIQDPFVILPGLENSRCFQSYAHSRITQLLHLRDAAMLLGDDVLEPVVKFSKPCNAATSLAVCIEEEALDLAIKANVVVRGMTGLVTVDELQCQTFEEETEICIDGTSAPGVYPSPDTGGQLSLSVLVTCILCVWLTFKLAE